MNANISTPEGLGLTGKYAVNYKQPYIATSGRHAGHSVVSIPNGQMDKDGQPIMVEQRIQTNATLRKDEWIDLEDAILEAARERLVIVDDLISAGLTYNVGGLGTLISEWEEASEMTDADVTMDGETVSDKDRQVFNLAGVPIPVIHKDFKIGERQLLASRTRGAALDVTMGVEAARAVARRSESLVFFGGGVAASNSAGNSYTIPGLTTFADRATFTISDWSDDANVSPETIFTEILEMVQKLENEERRFGPFTLYIPAAYSFRFRQDFKANSDKTLMTRVTDEDVIANVRVSDVLTTGNVLLIEMSRSVLDLAIASDLTTVQWQSGSGFTNQFKNYAAWAPRLKKDYDGHCGILHGTTA